MEMENNLWEKALEQLKLQMSRATFETWLMTTTGELRDGTLTVTLPNTYALDWIERLRPIIENTVERIAGRPLNVAFTTPAEEHRPASERSRSEPRPGEIAIELVEFDPTRRGFVMTANYAVRFWQPYLGPLPFALWLTLRSFAWNAGRGGWPSIQTLADICANGNRHRILGRAARAGRKPITGALQVLENERIVWVKRTGEGRQTNYRFRVLANLPLLTPSQVQQLPANLQKAHDRFVRSCSVDHEEWNQLTLPTLTERILMSGT